MTETRTLQFESPRTLQSLYANDIKLLKNLEDSLGVKVTTREGWVKLEGDPSHVDKAQQVFEQLEKARQQGMAGGAALFGMELVAEHVAALDDRGNRSAVEIERRGHIAAVDRVKVRWLDRAIRIAPVPIRADAPLRLEIWGAHRKSALLARVTDRPVTSATTIVGARPPIYPWSFRL